MRLAIDRENILFLLKKQIDNNFLLNNGENTILDECFDKTLDRCDYNFSHSQNKYYYNEGETYFDPYHSGQYSIFLYYLSNSVWKYGDVQLANKIYYLNKSLNSCDLFYEVKLPQIFFLDHPVGSVLGRADYSNYFSFAQNCTVGNNKGVYPSIGENVKMCANSMILGNCKIGSDVILSANSYVKDQDVPSHSIVFGSSPNLIIKKRQ